VQEARPYVYTTAAPAMLACALAASLHAIASGRARRARLERSIGCLRAGLADVPWDLLPSSTPIQALVIGDSKEAMALSDRLWSQRIFVPAIRPPTVPHGTARLRISLSAAHTDADIDELLAALRAAC